MKPISKEVSYDEFQIVRKLLKKKGQFKIHIHGSSMYPLYKAEGEVDTLLPINVLNDIKKFDIIVFWQNNILLSHYFWKRNINFNESTDNPTLITRPLNPIKNYDHPINFDQVLGIVQGKNIGLWLKLKIYFNIIF